MILGKIKFVSTGCAWNHFILIADGLRLARQIILQEGLRVLAQRQLDTADLRSSTFQLGIRSGNITLIAIEDR